MRLDAGQLAILELDGQPGAGVGPPGVGSAGRDAEHEGALGKGQAAEVAQLDEFGEFGLFDRKPRERFVECFDGVVSRRRSRWSVSRSTRRPPPRFAALPARARSTRIRRIAARRLASRRCASQRNARHQASRRLRARELWHRASGRAFPMPALPPRACGVRRRPAAAVRRGSFLFQRLRCRYFARSACHFLASSGLFVAVYSSISRSRAWGRRSGPHGRDFSRCFIPS